MDILKQFFGDPQQQNDYSDFVNRAQNDPTSISEQEAARRYHELARQAPPEMLDETNQAVYSQLPANMRSQMAQSFQTAHNDPNSPFQGYNYNNLDEAADPRNLSQMTRRVNEQDPNLFGQIAGNPIGRAAMAAGAAYLASRMLGGNQAGGLGGLGGMLGGGMPGGGGLGGALGGGGLGGGMSGGGLGGLLGGLLGGDTSGTSHRR